MKKEQFKGFVFAAFCFVLFSGYAQAFMPDNGKQSGIVQGQAIDEGKDGNSVLLEKIKTGGEKIYKAGELLVKFKKGTSDSQKKSRHSKHHAKRLKKYKHIEIDHVRLDTGVTVENAIAQYKADPDVEYAEPNYIVKALGMPNDPLLGNLWGMNNTGQTGGTSGADIKAPQAWDITTGSNDVVVTVIDTGIDYTHEDIIQNLWVNTGEIPGNGIDDDGNGYIDDVYGINAITGTGDPWDDHGHGTHCAGTIGAVGNNEIGVAGVNWNLKIMACKFLDASGSGAISDAAECLDYVKMMKDRGVNVAVTSNSWGGGGYSQAFYDSLMLHMQSDILFVAAAGNSNSDNDIYTFFPSGYDLPNVVAVAATDHNDARASFSSYGRHTVHVSAPGVDIVSLRAGVTDMYGDGQHFIPSGDSSAKYYKSSGTSMATPHVAGLAALVKSADAGRDWKQIKNLIISSGDDVGSMNGITISGKRINAYEALTCSNHPLFSILSSPSSFTIGESVTLAALSIDCGSAAGPVTARASTGEVIELRDDGVSPDLAAGDGIFTATWTPSAPTSSLLFTSPFGSVRTPPPAIVSNYLLEGNTRYDYQQSLEVAGGMPPFAWSLVSGDLPPGLALDGSTGAIAGRPTTPGKYSFRVQVTDSEFGAATKDLIIPVADHSIVEAWARIPGSGSGNGVVAGSDGYVYVAGQISNELGGYDFLTVKYDSAGNTVWQRTYRKSGVEKATGVALDGNGNIYVVGTSNNGAEISVVSYDASGNPLWDRAVTSGLSAGVAIDRDGNIIVAGTVYRPNTGDDYVIVKLDRQGNEIWKSFYDNGGTTDDVSGITVDGNGNILVTGDTFAQSSNGYDYLTVKLDSSGSVAWARTYNIWEFDWTSDIAVDSTGNVYVTGTQAMGSFLTLKYDPQGNLAWTRTYSSGIASGGLGLTLDQYDNVYVSGYAYNGVRTADFLLLKYNSSGTLLWTKKGDRGNAQHYQLRLAVASDGALYAAGRFDNDFFVQAYRDTSLHITAPAAGYGLVNHAFNMTLTAAGGGAPYAWSITSGSLPAGLTLDGSTGAIAGTPTQVGTFIFTAQVADASASAAKQLCIYIYDPLAITTASLPAGVVSGYYAQTLAASGGALPYYWTLISGSLPAGLALDRNTGLISGVPTAEGTSAFTVRVTDVTKATVDHSLSISVSIDTLAPTTTASPSGGSYVAAQTVRLTTSETATIYCTTDGTTPVIPDSVCTGSMTVTKSITLKYFAVDLVGNTEAVKTAVYVITGGEARSWGNNASGQLGDGTTSTRLTPVLVNGISDIVSVTSGAAHTVVLRNDGTVWAWGGNGNYQLGDGTTSARYSPVQVSGMTGVTAIAAGSNHTIALKNDGTVWSWGNNNYGQLGGSGYGNIPVQAVGLTDVVAIAGGYVHSLALKKDGTVWAWGANLFGQLGDGTDVSRNTPLQVMGLTDVVAITCGNNHSAVVRSNGDVWYWGDAGITGDFTNVLMPKKMAGIDNVVQLAGGDHHMIARKSDGSVWAWGHNDYGQLGNGSTWSYRWTAAPVTGLANITAIASGYNHSLALRNDGTVWAWGKNASGQLGNGQTTNRNIPIQVSGLSSAAALAAGENHSIALRTATLAVKTTSLPEGAVNYVYSQTLTASGGLAPYAWSISSGSLPSGLALGGSTGVISGTPTVVGTYSFTVLVRDSVSATATKQLSIKINEPLAISTAALASGTANSAYSQVLAAAGGLPPYQWSISAGVLPTGLILNSATGELSGTPSEARTFALTVKLMDAINMATEKQFSLLINPDVTAPTSTAYPPGGSYLTAQTVRIVPNETATVYCTTDGTTPTIPESLCSGQLNVIKSVTLKFFAVDTFGNREEVKTETYAITGGTVQSWGYNNWGQLGDGTATTSSVPVSVSGLGNTVAVAAGAIHTVSLMMDGTVWVWGNNAYGQLGDGTGANQNSPVQVSGLSGVVAVASGGYHTIALKNDGTVWAWGHDAYGQLGDGSMSNRPTPVQVSGLSGVVAIAGGGYHTMALKNDGTVWTWGQNYYGQLGDGTGANKYSPVQVSGLSGVVAIAGGMYHTMALKNDGTVWTWGANWYGQLGDGTTGTRYTPVQVAGLTNVVAIAAGESHSVALKNDGTAWAWGVNWYGQLGDGSTSNRLTPVQVSGLSGVVAIAGGKYHTIALRNDGAVWAWGVNWYGQLGDGTTNDSLIPVQVNGLNDAFAIAGGEYHTLAIKKATLAVQTSSLPSGISNHSYSETLTASGGLAPYTWSITAGSLPPGLTLNSVSGELSGIPTASGSFTFTVQVADISSATASQAFSLSVFEPLSILTNSLPAGTVGASYNQMFTASGGSLPYLWSIADGSLPPGLTLDSATGTIAGGPTTSGTFNITMQVTDSRSVSTTKEFSIVVYDPLIITTTSLSYGITGTTSCRTLAASGGRSPYIWSITGASLPPGLSLNSATGEICGVPAAVGTWTFTVQVTDNNSTATIKEFSLSVYDPLVIKPVTWWIVPIEYYASWTHIATGGVQPYTWSISAGRLPNGLALDSATGRISGTPDELGWFYYTLQVTDAVGAVDTEPYSLYSYNMLDIDTKTLPFGTRGAAYSQTVLASGGRTPYTWSVTSGALPAGLSMDSATSVISGTPTATGSFTFTVTVRDAHASSDAQQLTIVIYEPLAITTGSLPGGALGSSYSQTLAATGGLAPYAWTVSSGSLPAGLSLNSASGDLSGTLTSAGTYSFAIQVADANGSSKLGDLAVPVNTVIEAVSGANGAITPSGLVPVNAGDAKTFTITPDTGYHVSEVLVNGVSVGTVTTYTFDNVTANHTISATFAINTYTVTPTAGPNGSLSPSVPQTVNHLQSAVFSAGTYTGYHIDSVTGCGGTLNGGTYTTGPITADCTVTATFAINTYTVTPTAGPNGTISPATLQMVDFLQFASFTITPNTGYHIASVTGCSGTLNGNTYVTGPVTDDCTVSATFAINTYTVTPTAGPNGSLSPSMPQTVNHLQSAVFSAATYTGYHIDSVTGCGGTLNGGTYTTGPISADCTVTATFAINTYTVTPTAGPNGTISPSTPQPVNYNQAASFTLTPNNGYHIDTVSGCNGTLNNSTYTTGPVTADCTVTAAFAIDTHSLTVMKAGTGSGTVTSSPSGINCGTSCSATYDYGTSVTLTAARNPDSLFAGWSGGGCSGTGTCVTTMDADKAETATFTQYITVTTPNGGESWTRGTTYTIRWNYAGNPGSNVKIELLKGGVVNRTITNSTSRGTGGSGSYSWRISNNQATGSDYTIRVTSTSNSNYQDVSNANFTIQ